MTPQEQYDRLFSAVQDVNAEAAERIRASSAPIEAQGYAFVALTPIAERVTEEQAFTVLQIAAGASNGGPGPVELLLRTDGLWAWRTDAGMGERVLVNQDGSLEDPDDQ